MDVKVPDPETLGERDLRLQFFKDNKLDENGKSTGIDVKIDEVSDEENEELLGYNITIYNWDEEKDREANKKVINAKIDELGIPRFPGLDTMLNDFLARWGRDYFIHKKLKTFLKGELEWYLFQVLKGDTQGRIDVLAVEKQIEEIKAKHAGDNDYIEYAIGKIYSQETKDLNPSLYQKTYAWIENFINILSDLEEFKAKLWNKKRKIIKQEYCITLGKIKDFESTIPVRKDLFNEILNNEKQLNVWEEEIKSEKHLAKISLDIIKSELSSGDINVSRNLVVDTNYFSRTSKLYEKLKEWGEKKLYEEGEKLDGIMIKSENYQGLKVLVDDYKEKVQGTYIDPPFNLGENGDFLYKTDYLDGSWASMLLGRYEFAKQLMNNTASIFTRCDYNGGYVVKQLCDDFFGEGNFMNEIIVGKSNRIKTKGNKYLSWYDNVFFWAKNINNIYFKHLTKKSENGGWRNMDKPGEVWAEVSRDLLPFYSAENIKWEDGVPKSRAKIVLGKECMPPANSRFPSQETIKKLEEKGEIRLNDKGNPQMKRPDTVYLTDNRTDLFGYAIDWKFTTENSEPFLKRIIETCSEHSQIILDYFAGSATTQAVAQKLGRRWIGVEIGRQFENFDLRRLKSVMEGKESGISKDEDVDYKGGGFFTYLYLNQYEDWFSSEGYLSTIEDEILELTNLQDLTKISHILMPLNELKEHIYNIDDELSNDQLLAMSRMANEK